MTLGTNGNGYWRASTIGGNIKMVSNQPAINVNGYSASAIAFGSDNNQGRIGFFTTSSNTGDTVLTESMRIDTNGNVGIGTTSPNSKLDVYTATTGGNIRLSSNTSTTYGEIRFSSNNGMYLGYGSSIEGTGEGVGVNVGDLRFKTGSGATPTTRMRIAGSGNVLIGTTTDAGTDKLQVAGSILASTAGIKIGSTTTSIESDGTSLYLKAGGNTYLNTNISAYVSNAGVMIAAKYGRSSAGTGYLSGEYSGTETTSTTGPIYCISSTYAPTSTALSSMHGIGYSLNNFTGAFGPANTWGMYVATNGSAGVFLGGNGVANFASTVTATGFFNSSDRRLKDIISRDGDMITFTWKDKRDELVHIGYIAQEVQKTYPDQVLEGGDGMLSVNYIEILVAKIQELENRIKQLEK